MIFGFHPRNTPHPNLSTVLSQPIPQLLQNSQQTIVSLTEYPLQPANPQQTSTLITVMQELIQNLHKKQSKNSQILLQYKTQLENSVQQKKALEKQKKILEKKKETQKKQDNKLQAKIESLSGSFVCQMCERRFINKESLEIHLDKRHRQKQNHQEDEVAEKIVMALEKNEKFQNLQVKIGQTINTLFDQQMQKEQSRIESDNSELDIQKYKQQLHKIKSEYSGNPQQMKFDSSQQLSQHDPIDEQIQQSTEQKDQVSHEEINKYIDKIQKLEQSRKLNKQSGDYDDDFEEFDMTLSEKMN